MKREVAKKVAFLLPDLRGGGAERVNVNLANEFVARGMAVDMVLVNASGEFLDQLDSRVRVVDLGVARMRGLLGPLIRYLRETRPSSLLSCMWPLTVLAVAARVAANADTRVVVAEHTTWSASEQSGNRFHRFILVTTMRIAFPRAAGVVTVSRGAADDLAKIAGLARERVRVIYNPIVGGAKASSEEGIPEPLDWATGAHHKVLAVGTLKDIKDYATLLQAFATLNESLDAKLLILGEGEERSTLEQLVSSLGLEERVLMPGFVPDPSPYFAHADLHVLTSTGEGFGNVIVEALEQGTPVVSTDCPSGPREILQDGKYGTLVPVGDPDALARAMQEALLQPHDHDALKRRAQDFSVAKAADAYLDVLMPDWRARDATTSQDAARSVDHVA